MTFRIGRVWGRFHHRVARRLTGRQPWRVRDELWLYPLLEYAMAEAGFQEVETYVSCHQNTVAHFIATRPIMDLCLVQPPAPLCGAGGATACAGGMEGAGAVRQGRHALCPLAAQGAGLVAERKPGSRVAKRWWEQDGLDVEGVRVEAREAERTEEGGERDRTETETYYVGGRIM